LNLATGGRLLVLSPHLDDAVLSIGAAIAHGVRHGAAVSVLTVLAGDPGSEAPAGEWDRRAGFHTAGEAVRARREEDQRACAILGAIPIWLSWGDDQYERGGDDEIWTGIRPAIASADAVLAPGFPLSHGDHAWLAGLVMDRADEETRIGFYAEQPYALWTGRPSTPPLLQDLLAEPLRWKGAPSDKEARVLKRRALRAYVSQLRLMPHRHLLPWRLARYEWTGGGEPVAWLSSTKRRR
jgi:LmbE family N-acetylglucosaminyl deacetylase